jgi:NAD-dependent deacetylase
MNSKIRSLNIGSYKNIVVLTGAGISVASGLRTYRGPGGIWEEGDTARVSHVDILQDEPALVWKFFGPLKKLILEAQPNAAHLALAQLEERLGDGQSLTLITQNIDRLHTRAGNSDVLEFHGTLLRTRCSNEKCALLPFEDSTIYEGIPPCSQCGAMLRPDVVFFGEEIPLDAGWKAKLALRSVDLFIAIGTSGLVSPAANFVRSAKYVGAKTLLVNLEKMDPPDPAFDLEILGKAEETLPTLLGFDKC